MNMQESVLIVDYGGVLSDHHQLEAESALAEIFDVDISKIRTLLGENSEHGAAVREGRIDENIFWNTVTTLTGIRKCSRPSNDILSKLWAKTYKFNLSVYSLLARVRNKHPIGILTNIDCARSNYLVNEVDILSKVDFYFPSYKYGSLKPKPEIWQSVTDELKNRISQDVEIIYFDDRERHVTAAKKYGWNAIEFKCLSQFEYELIKLEMI